MFSLSWVNLLFIFIPNVANWLWPEQHGLKIEVGVWRVTGLALQSYIWALTMTLLCHLLYDLEWYLDLFKIFLHSLQIRDLNIISIIIISSSSSSCTISSSSSSSSNDHNSKVYDFVSSTQKTELDLVYTARFRPVRAPKWEPEFQRENRTAERS